MPKKLTQEEFLAKAVAVHGVGRYDYSQTVYRGSTTKVKIVCPEHGEFAQTPNSHTDQKNGCPKCGLKMAVSKNNNRKLGQIEFLNRARATHGERYDYSQVVCTSATDKVTIICRKHGSFQQRAIGHITGKGCYSCRNCGDLENFVKTARNKYGDKYNYSRVVYTSSSEKVIITCPVHGDFKQTPSVHLATKCGCPKCGLSKAIATAEGHRIGVEQFMFRARNVHGDAYDYSQAIYISRNKKVTILCLHHGPFTQSAGSHMRGRGCAKCRVEKLRSGWIAAANGRTCTLYLLRFFNENESFFKVGITVTTVKNRYSGGRSSCYKYEVFAQHRSTNAAAIWDWEQSILETFTHLRYIPKQAFGGETECFSSADEILAIFPL